MTDNRIEMAQMWLECFNDKDGRGPNRVMDILDMNYDADGVIEILQDLDGINQDQHGIDEFRDFLGWYIEDVQEG